MTTVIQKWMLRAVLTVLGFAGLVALCAGTASAETTEPTQPIPGIMLPQELINLGNQAGAALQGAQNDIVVAQTQLEQTVTAALQPVPAPMPEFTPEPATPSVFGSPEADKIVTDLLPKSLPEIAQDIVDPVHEAWLSTMYGGQVSLPDETMDKNTPLSKQVATTVNLFTVHQVAPNVAACGSNNHLHETACAAGIVEMNKTGSAPMATINVIGKYGFNFYITEYGTPCYGDVLSLQYCDDNIWLSELMMQYGVAIAEDRDPSLGERVAVIGHEEGHHQDAVKAREDQFYLHLSENIEHVLASEQNADTEAGRVLQRAVNNGQLSVEDAESGYALFPRLGHTNEDGTPEETHGSSDMRANASRNGQREVLQGEYALAA